MKKVTIELIEDEYRGLVQFLRQRAVDIEADEEDLGLLLPLLRAYQSRVLWTEWMDTK